MPGAVLTKRVTVFMTSELHCIAGDLQQEGCFILDMGEQVKIMDLAQRLIYLSGRNIKHGVSWRRN